MSDELPEGLDIIDTDAGQKEKICAAAEIALEEAKGKYFEQSEAISTICQDFIDLKDSASAELFFRSRLAGGRFGGGRFPSGRAPLSRAPLSFRPSPARLV